MFNIGEYVVYKKDVCKIKDIKVKHINDKDYYKLEPLDDPTLIIDIPVENAYIRKLISTNEVEEIIRTIPKIKKIECDEKMLENEYRCLLNSDNHIDLIKIIKTTYLRNKQRLDNKKKVGNKDDNYFKKAEKYLYNEFSIVLNMSYDDTKDYIINRVTNMEKNNEK